MGIVWHPDAVKANGGTEQLCRELEELIDPSLLAKFQIFASKVTEELDPTKIRILWCHDLAEDPAVAHLENDGWIRYHRIVFVSHTQKNEYIAKFKIPPSRCVVLLNAIHSIDLHEKPDPKNGIRLIYTSTPHRGLNILYAVFRELCQKHDDLHLDVYSSYNLYGWNNADEPYKELFDQLRAHPKISYHGSVSKDEVRAALKRAHILAYPNTWRETSCRVLMEAMSANLVSVHSDLGALPETAANWTIQYGFNENLEQHAGMFMSALDVAINTVRQGMNNNNSQKMYADVFYSWPMRAQQWTAFLGSLLKEDTSIPSLEPTFRYSVG